MTNPAPNQHDVPIQEHTPAELAVCYGCGHANPHEMGIRTHWNGSEGVCRFSPPPEQVGYPGIVYGGLLACVVDCHCIGTAVAEAYETEGRTPGAGPAIAFVTANLNLDYILPTPMGPDLELTARVTDKNGRKSVVECEVRADGHTTVRGRVIAIRTR